MKPGRLSPGQQMVGSIIMDWTPHADTDEPVDTIRGEVFRLCDEAYEALIAGGCSDSDDTASTVRIMLSLAAIE